MLKTRIFLYDGMAWRDAKKGWRKVEMKGSSKGTS
jgi:hypothetical protein